MSYRNEIETAFREGRRLVEEALSSENDPPDERAAVRLMLQVLSTEIEASLLVLSRQISSIAGPDPQL